MIKKYFKTKYFLSFTLGLLTALAFAPTYYFIFTILGFTGLFLILDEAKNKKESFWIGYNFGLGQFLLGLYWISISLFVDIARFFWLLPFSLFLIPAVMAVYTGFATLFTNLISSKFKISRGQKLLLFALSWLFFEYLRAILFTGFPWNLIGYSLGFSDALLQNAALFGVYGLSLAAVIFYTSPSLFILEIKNFKPKFYLQKSSLILFLAIFISFSLMFFYGFFRLKNAKNEFAENGNVRIVQPSTKQEEKWSSEMRYNSFLRNIELSTSESLENINYVIWAETAVPYIIEKNSQELLSEIARAVPKNGFLITGGLRAEFKENSIPKEIVKIWNSIFVINENGQVISSYDKNHLVPFGEYVPFAKYLPFVSKITDGGVDFGVGDGLKTMEVEAAPSFSPLICYEAIFPGKVINEKTRPQFLLNLTNDAWFGDSSGPHQHFDMVRMRAVEYGIPLVRVANSGISALIDPYGQVASKIDLNQKGIIDVKLMKNLPDTYFSIHQNKILIYFVCALLLLILIPFSPKKNEPKSSRHSHRK